MKIWTKFRMLLAKRRLEREMAAEMQAHLDGLAERHIAKGLSPEEARFAARREFGGVEQIKERARDERMFVWLEQLGQDLRQAMRQCRRSPGFTFIVVGSLALGLGANTALFSLVDEVVLRSLPVTRPNELVGFRWLAVSRRIPLNGLQGRLGFDRATGGRTGACFSYEAFEQFRTTATTLRAVWAYGELGGTFVIDGRRVSERCNVVSGNYFNGLGVSAQQGRTFAADDDRAEAPPALVITHEFWQSRLGGTADAVGKTIMLNGVNFTVVGITPRGFAGAGEYGEAPAAFVPMAMMPRLEGYMGFEQRPLIWWVNIMGRLKPGVPPRAAQAELDPVLHHSIEAAWRAGEPGAPGKSLDSYEVPRLQIVPGGQGLTAARQAYKQPLFLIGGIVGGVLLLTCLNVASLLLARALARRREIALRLSLGAGRARIVRQMVTESLLLSLLGGSLGLLLAFWGRDALLQFWPIGNGQFSLDARVFVFAFGLALLAGLSFGVGPAWRASGLNLEAALKAGSSGALGRTRSRFRSGLMIAQVAIAVVLLIGTGLFLRTLHNFAALDVGFERDHLVYFNLDPGASRTTPAQRNDLIMRVQETIDPLPGVQSSALVARPLLSNSSSSANIVLSDAKLPAGQSMHASINQVGAPFFKTLGIPLVLGRTFEPDEMEGKRDVVVVNETFARTFFPGENPIGRTFGLPRSHVTGQAERKVEIVGVVADARYADLRSKIPPTFYQPLVTRTDGRFVVRTVGEPHVIVASVRAALRELAPDAALLNVRTQQETVDQLLTMERMFARLCLLFGVVALALTSLGLYGLLAYDVAARTREIGLRLALGAQVGAVISLVMRQGMGLMLSGLILGLAVAAGVTRFIAAMLFQVSLTDGATFAGVSAVLVIVALLACWLPARRAAKVDPMVALRAE